MARLFSCALRHEARSKPPAQSSPSPPVPSRAGLLAHPNSSHVPPALRLTVCSLPADLSLPCSSLILPLFPGCTRAQTPFDTDPKLMYPSVTFVQSEPKEAQTGEKRRLRKC